MNAEENGGRRSVQDQIARVVDSDLDDPLPIPPEWNDLTRRIIACAMEVHSTLGPGLLERLYEEAFAHELQLAGLSVRRQVEIALPYKGITLPAQRLDMVVDDLIVVELKASESVPNVHLAQLVSYLRAANLPVGLLINFNTSRLKDGLYRRLNERSTHRPKPPIRS